MKLRRHFGIALAFLAMTILLASCGKSNNTKPILPAGETTITGIVYAAPVAGASVVVKNASGTSVIAGPVTTGIDGTYSVDVPTSALDRDLIFSSSSGTFIDEASDTVTAAGTLAAYVEGGTLTAGSNVTLDPSSTITCDLVMNYGKTASAAKTNFGNGFGFYSDPSIVPEPVTNPLSSSDAAQRHRGLVAAAFSQLTQDLGLSAAQRFDLFAALAEDISDGKLDGMNGPSAVTVPGTAVLLPIAIQKNYFQAVDNASRTAFTSTYKVDYVPGTMAAVKGKTMFTIRVTKLSDSSAAPGLTVSLMPMMHMLAMGHSTPSDVVTDNGDGTYSCSVYYMMPSVMSGMAMGYWELQVAIGGMSGDTVTFYPYVGMAMGSDTINATLYGLDDIVSSESGTQYNRYYLFRDGPVSAPTSTMDLFISHGEDMNMNFVSVSNGSVLSSPTGTVTAMTVEASTDSTFTSPLTGTDIGNGHWSIPGLAGLVSSSTTTIYVRLSVNGQDKTTNGAAAQDSNAYAMFVVTPQ